VAQESLIIRLDNDYDEKQVDEMIDFLITNGVRLVRFTSGQIGFPQDLRRGRISARIHFEDEDTAIYFKMRFA
jgi:hypothetical protein